jgi:beta-lactamase class D
MNIDIRTDEDAAARLRITRAILRDLDLMDAE